MFIQYVKFRSRLSWDDLMKKINERKPEFQALSGLIQKYYTKDDQTGEIAGVYIWDSMDSLKEFRDSELARTIPSAYQAEGPPKVEILEVFLILREKE